ncbi:MAG: hypothetical protein KDC98_06440 [Planctomycetes bacterium]|nr:hypothetical protein [Planctomycetota bacterium]
MAETRWRRAATAEMDKVLKEYPSMASFLMPAVFNALMQSEEPQHAVALQPRVCDVLIANEDAESLNSLAWMIVDPAEEIEKRDLATAERAAKKAVELTKEQDWAIIDTLARVHFWKQDYKQAVVWQRKAVALCEEGEDRDGLAATLAEYEELLGGK